MLERCRWVGQDCPRYYACDFRFFPRYGAKPLKGKDRNGDWAGVTNFGVHRFRKQKRVPCLVLETRRLVVCIRFDGRGTRTGVRAEAFAHTTEPGVVRMVGIDLGSIGGRRNNGGGGRPGNVVWIKQPLAKQG